MQASRGRGDQVAVLLPHQPNGVRETNYQLSLKIVVIALSKFYIRVRLLATETELLSTLEILALEPLLSDPV